MYEWDSSILEPVYTLLQIGCQSNVKKMADSVDPYEIAHYKSSHLDLHCLLRYLCYGLHGRKG